MFEHEPSDATEPKGESLEPTLSEERATTPASRPVPHEPARVNPLIALALIGGGVVVLLVVVLTILLAFV